MNKRKSDGVSVRLFSAELRDWRRRRPPSLDPKRCALLIIDMQEYFLRPDSHAFVPPAPAIIPRLKRIQDCFLEAGRPVIQTRHLNRLGRAGLMETWWRDLIQASNPLSAVTPELADPRAMVMIKSRYDAFFRTRLESILRRRRIAQLVVGGLLTHLCVETTIRSAFVRGFSCLLLLDGTATFTPAFYQGSVRNLAHGFAVPARIEDICRRVR